MLNPFSTVRLDHGAFKAWPLFAAALVVLWSLLGQAPFEAGALLAVLHVAYFVGAVLLLLAAITITLRQPPVLRSSRAFAPALLKPGRCDHTPEADTPPPRTTVRD